MSPLSHARAGSILTPCRLNSRVRVSGSHSEAISMCLCGDGSEKAGHINFTQLFVRLEMLVFA